MNNNTKHKIIYVSIFLTIIALIFFIIRFTQKDTYINTQSACSSCHKKLLPIMDPKFNLREVAKHLILLEDHLFHEGKRCPDCCIKHGLTIDGLLDEAKTLDKEQQHTDIIENTSSHFKQILQDLETNIKNGNLSNSDICIKNAQQLRDIRKVLTNAIITNKI